jgi:hypothetical protein
MIRQASFREGVAPPMKRMTSASADIGEKASRSSFRQPRRTSRSVSMTGTASIARSTSPATPDLA